MYAPHVMGRIRRLPGVFSVDLGAVGEVNVCLESQDRALRAEVLAIGRDAMLPVRVFYKMPDGRVIGESVKEDVSDYYKNIEIPGFASTTASEAPPEEVAAEPKGALKLKRLRGKTRGRPVLGWKYGDKEVRKGTEITFNAATSLRWTMGRTLNVKPGSKAKVSGLATNRPIIYLALGAYDGVECPVHAIGHSFDVSSKKKAKTEAKEEKNKGPINNTLGYKASEIARLVNAVGFGQQPGFGRPDDDDDDTPSNSPYFDDPDVNGPATARDADSADGAFEGIEEEDCECSSCSTKDEPKDPRFDQKDNKAQRVALFGRK